MGETGEIKSREREGERDIYIYIYREREDDAKATENIASVLFK
jgi:hypothetical protein